MGRGEDEADRVELPALGRFVLPELPDDVGDLDLGHLAHGFELHVDGLAAENRVEPPA